MTEILKATAEDYELINRIASVAFPETYKQILTPEQIDYMMHWMYDISQIEKQMKDEGHVYFIAYEDGEAAGYVSVRPDGKDCFHLEKIYLLPEYHKKHLGGRLFRHAISYIKEIHPTPCIMELNVNRNNPALDFYLHMGMSIDREGDFDIGGGYYMNDYIMKIDI